ncbi:8493_t:CDS:10, partial [Dentiscutata erythropus]
MTSFDQVEYKSKSRNDLFEKNFTHLDQRTQAEQIYIKEEPEEMPIKQFNGSSDTISSNNVIPELRKSSSSMISLSSSISMELRKSNSDLSNADFSCPICLDIMKEAFVGRCGHSFCYLCIIGHLDIKSDCPMCGSHLTKEQIYPNFSLNKILEMGCKEISTPTSPAKQLKEKILKDDLSVEDINTMVVTLLAKKKKFESMEKEDELNILHDFLSRAKAKKQEQLSQISKEIEYLNDDLVTTQHEIDCFTQRQKSNGVEGQISEEFNNNHSKIISSSDDKESDSVGYTLQPNERHQTTKKRKHTEVDSSTKANASYLRSCSGTTLQNFKDTLDLKLQNKKQRMLKYIDDLEQYYFSSRLKISNSHESLSNFTSALNTFTRYSNFRLISTFRYGDIFNTSSIVSAIEFDRDDEYFATAGVTKKIKIFEFGNIERNGYSDAFGGHSSSSIRDSIRDSISGPRKVMDSFLQYPIKEMSSDSKISCLSWNNYVKSHIASADYDGIVSLWDVITGNQIMTFDEHEKRTWSVDFGKMEPTKLASGSDDARVKIWSTTQQNSICTLESQANVCCVKFNPEIPHYVAFGSADHHIHYYDLRYNRQPVFIYKGHRKAVSYVKFMGRNELISASTDSTLKLWDIESHTCVRTYAGHVNEKNFVGLSVSSDWIGCGSEDNCIYAYNKTLCKPIIKYKFGNINAVTGKETFNDDPSLFVSSVCWKKSPSTLLAANSQGTIK